MGCNCGKREKVILNPRPQTPEELHTQEMNEYASTLTGMTYDWYNNIDTIEPIKPKENE